MASEHNSLHKIEFQYRNDSSACVKGYDEKVPTFGTSGFAVPLLRLAKRSPLHQRRVLARARCIQANGHDTRRDTVLQSSAATLAKSSAPTAVRTEIASQRSSLLQTSGCRGCLVAGNNHAGNARCSGAARRATGAFAALLRLLQQHTAHAVLEATCSESSRNIELLTAKSFSSGLHSRTRAGCARATGKERTDGIA